MADDRDAWLAHLGDPAAHARIATDLPSLHEVRVHEPPADHEPLTGWVRVAAWNLERGRYPDEMAEVLRRTGAQVVLLSEADVGMARSSNRDVPVALARALGVGAAFGVEFVELGLGDATEAAAVAAAGGGRNAHGLHGNAILSPTPVHDLRAVRIELRGDWFHAERGQPRVGGRMAVVGRIDLYGEPVTVASVHLESASDPDDRAAQLAVVMDAVDEVTGSRDGPAIVGGDLNTFGASFASLADRSELRRMREADPARFSWPVAHEPVFAVARDHGYDWLDANLAAPTTNHAPDGAPHHHPLHLDWLFTRGLEARRPTIVPAVDPQGRTLSDHQPVAVSVRRRRPR